MLNPKEYCPQCGEMVGCRIEDKMDVVYFRCVECGRLLDWDIKDND